MFFKARSILPANIKGKVKNLGISTLKRVLSIIEPLTGTLITFSTRPLFADLVWVDVEEAARDYSDFAIVMQGPLNMRNDFTLETLKIYKKYYPSALIILTTWDDEDIGSIDKIRSIGGIEVVLSKKPPNTGRLNMNMQLTNTRAGLEVAAKRGIKFSMKTRTDQRFYNRGTLRFLSNMVEQFPLTISSSAQRGRVMALGCYDPRVKAKFYHVFDNLIFGYTEDVLTYFSADLISDNHEIEFLKENYPGDPYTAEIYFVTEFLKKTGHVLKYTAEDYLRAISAHFIFIDGRDIGWYWYKYERQLEYQIYDMSYRKIGNLSFPEWFNLYHQHTKDGKECCK